MSGFSHPNFGKEVRVVVEGREVMLIFVAGSNRQADDFAQELVRQLSQGGLHLTLMGEPTSIEET